MNSFVCEGVVPLRAVSFCGVASDIGDGDGDGVDVCLGGVAIVIGDGSGIAGDLSDDGVAMDGLGDLRHRCCLIWACAGGDCGGLTGR